MTQTITENIYASVTHNISQKSTAKVLVSYYRREWINLSNT